MKTTVKSTNGGGVTVDRIGRSLASLEHHAPGLPPEATYYEKHALYVLGHALVNLAMTMEAEEGGYELCGKVSGRIACTFRKGTKCPDCGPAQSLDFPKVDCLCPTKPCSHQLEIQNMERKQGVRCHGDMCAGGQVACPSPKACGVA